MRCVLIVLVFLAVSLGLAVPAVAAPDLTIPSMWLDVGDEEAYPGETIRVFVNTKNQGTSDIPGLPGFENGVYLSTDATITTGDTQMLAYWQSGMVAGFTRGLWEDVTIPASTAPGSYYVGAIADWNNTIAESSESNNME